MGVLTVDYQVAMDTSTGLQTITTTDLGGLTPKGAKVKISRATANGTKVDHAVLQWGATDGTNMVSMCAASKDGVNPTDSGNLFDSALLISIIDAVTPTGTDGKANLASGGGLIADGIKINITEAPGSAYLMQWTFYAGSDRNISVGSTRSITTGAHNVTGMGFTPESIEAASTAGTAASGTIQVSGRMSLGFYDGTTQGALTIHDRDNLSPSQLVGHVSTTDIIDHLGTAAVSNSLTASALTSGGFTLTPVGDWTSRNVGWLAVGTDGTAGVDVRAYDTPNSTGNKAITGLGFEPEYSSLLNTRLTARDSVDTTNGGGTFGVSDFDGTNEHAIYYGAADNQATANTWSFTDATAVDLKSSGGTSSVTVAAFVSNNADGYTLNFTTASTIYRFLSISYEGVAEAAGGLLASGRPLIIGL